MDRADVEGIRQLTNRLNSRDADMRKRLAETTADLRTISFRLHNDLQILLGTLYEEGSHTKDIRTTEAIKHILNIVSEISKQYKPIEVIKIKNSDIRILIVEDDPEISRYLNLAIEDLGYTIIGRTGRADIAVILATEQEPDIILMDIMLEGEISGIDAACEIKKKIDVPIIFATGRTDVGMVKEAERADPEGYLIKPFSPDQIYATIELALSRRGK